MGFPYLAAGDLLLWIGAWSIAGFAAMGIDKGLARLQQRELHPRRIREKTLHELALVGGFPGVVLGGVIFSHKTSKPSFWPPVGASLALWALALACLLRLGFFQLPI